MTVFNSGNETQGPKRPKKRRSNDESVDEAIELIEDESVDIEREVPVDENESIEGGEVEDDELSPVFEE